MDDEGRVVGRTTSLTVRLARLGFADAARAVELLEMPAMSAYAAPEILDSFAEAADPDLALRSLVRITETHESGQSIGAADRLHALARSDRLLRSRLFAVLGSSEALGDHLVRHPEHVSVLAEPDAIDRRPSRDELRADLLRAVGAGEVASEGPVARGYDTDVLDALRVAYRRHLLALAARDLVGGAQLDDVAGELADLADGVLSAALAIARAEVGDESTTCRLAVIGMGKCGGRELNYVSDVDVIFVAAPAASSTGDGSIDEADALAVATRLASSLMRTCSTPTGEGSIWEVDANLRPEGKSGALVRTLASHLSYYERWASTWEYQALLKARPSAGDVELGKEYIEAVLPFVWGAADRDHFVEDVQAMRRRVEENLPAQQLDRELKLGRGGLRDVEFAVQLLQLVHGRSDVMLRSGTTLVALEALSTWGYVGREDGSTLASAYRFLRTLEHRIQLFQLRRTHIVPDAPVDLRRLGRSMGFRSDPVAELSAEWRRHAREVRRIHEKLFYRPLLNAVARLDAGVARLTPQAAQQRLEALGYADPAGALRHIEALTQGVSRRAAIQRTLLPVLLGWFADAPEPDSGLLAFRRVSDALGSTPWYLRLLRDESAAAERMAHVLASSRYSAELLLRAPDAVTMLADVDELTPRKRDELLAESASAAARHDNPETAAGGVRGIRRRELFRTSVADIGGLLSPDEVGESLSRIARACVSGGLAVAIRSVEAARGGPLPMKFAVIAMGRFGGGELGYSSDADVMFVHEALEGADERDATDAAFAVANELRRLLMVPSPDPPLEIDADLRPEGKQGQLSRSLASFASYYQRWSSTWERQALVRARFVAGDEATGVRLIELIDTVRWDNELTDDEAREIRRLKARMESERLPRGADPALHTKLGRGGLSDVEWTVQLLQLKHAPALASLRTPRTLEALGALKFEGLLTSEDAEVLESAWLLATRVRNYTMLASGRASDMVPTDARGLTGVGHLLGYSPGDSGQLLEDYRRVTRRARGVVERVFYE